MKVFVMDVSKCGGCHNCQIACKDEHCGNDWMPYAKPQPMSGAFWLKLNNYVKGTVPKVYIRYVPVICQHCVDAPCIPACPNGAIYQREDGLVIIDPKKCTGNQLCIRACPYNDNENTVIYYNSELKISQKCTGCAHILDRGWPIKEPRCTDACIQEAWRFGEESDFSAEIASAETLKPEYGVKTRVYYLNLPKRFIAGTVYDPDTKEVVTGGTCTLSGDGSGTATTDGFGDFWFEGLKVGTFSVKIEAAGKTKTMDSISTEKDVNLGDIALAGGSAANPPIPYIPVEQETPIEAETEEPQEPIVSPDGKVQLLTYYVYEYRKGGAAVIRRIQGRVENLTSSAVTARITVDFIDIASKVVETQSVDVALLPNQIIKYEVYSGGIVDQEALMIWNSTEFDISVTTV
jgi:Fe-S-cluster-containing dehydrogenase component